MLSVAEAERSVGVASRLSTLCRDSEFFVDMVLFILFLVGRAPFIATRNLDDAATNAAHCFSAGANAQLALLSDLRKLRKSADEQVSF